MKFIYVDESGNNTQERFLTFAGLQVDATKLKRVMRLVAPVFSRVAEAFGGDLKELKSSKLVNGRGKWRGVDPELRKQLFTELCRFPSEISGGKLFCFVLDRNLYDASLTALDTSCGKWRKTAWLTGATAVAMFAQRANQRESNNKGLTVLIFDDNKMELPALSDFLVESSIDADEYCEIGKKASSFDHIVDTAFSIKSEHSTLVQISDACAFALRRRAELLVGGEKENWDGERDFIETAFGGFASRIQIPSKTWIKTPFCETANWLKQISVDGFNKWATI